MSELKWTNDGNQSYSAAELVGEAIHNFSISLDYPTGKWWVGHSNSSFMDRTYGPASFQSLEKAKLHCQRLADDLESLDTVRELAGYLEEAMASVAWPAKKQERVWELIDRVRGVEGRER